MTLVMSFVTAEKKNTKTKRKQARNRARMKTRLKKDKLSTEMFVMLNPRS